MLKDNFEFKKFLCTIHKTLIYYYNNPDNFFGYHCWDCLRDHNNKLFKENKNE